MKQKYICFLYGILFCSGSHMFRQDLMGANRYIEYIKAGWIEMSPFWGLMLMFVSVWIIYLIQDDS